MAQAAVQEPSHGSSSRRQGRQAGSCRQSQQPAGRRGNRQEEVLAVCVQSLVVLQCRTQCVWHAVAGAGTVVVQVWRCKRWQAGSEKGVVQAGTSHIQAVVEVVCRQVGGRTRQVPRQAGRNHGGRGGPSSRHCL